MQLQRDALTDLIAWRDKLQRKPLVLHGARQVGKSHLVEFFGTSHFNHCITINFEVDPQFKNCFEETLNPTIICDAIAAMTEQAITPGRTLLFLDEIQDCPDAIRALRYFKEKKPELHVIAAGSLLEFKLRQAKFRMPVGRVSFLYLHPLSFKEFLQAVNPEALSYLTNTSFTSPIPTAIHYHLLKQVRLYCLIGGMPEAIAEYLHTQKIQSVQPVQASIIETYEKDFGHFHEVANPEHLQICFHQLPLMIGEQIKYNKLAPDLRSRDLKAALSALQAASIIHRIQASAAQGLPLNAILNEKKFKYNFVDVGLVKRFNKLDAQLLLNEDIVLMNRGALAEQFVGQELLAYAPNYEKPAQYFWARDGYGTAEIDYVITHGKHILPIEVKAGKTGTLRSLKQFLLEYPSPIGLRLSQHSLSKQDKILSIPLYLISELPRLLDENIEAL